MKNSTRRFSALALAISVIACVFSISVSASPSVYSSESNSGIRHEICVSLDGTSAEGYYGEKYCYDALSLLPSDELLTELRRLMTETHAYFSSYDNCRDYAARTDCEGNDGRVSLIYTSFSASMNDYTNNVKGGWNREHVWPKSLGGFNTSGAGSDLHHIRPSDSRVNSSRNNNLYGNADGGKTVTGTSVTNSALGGLLSGGYFEPNDNVKGDVARICLYVYVRYGGEIGKCSDITNVFESVEILLEWCELDPVDTWEMGRNEVVYAIQGNRNVFIDYPEYAWLIFGEEIPDTVTPSGIAKLINTPDETEKENEGSASATEKPEDTEKEMTKSKYKPRPAVIVVCVACGLIIVIIIATAVIVTRKEK